MDRFCHRTHATLYKKKWQSITNGYTRMNGTHKTRILTVPGWLGRKHLPPSSFPTEAYPRRATSSFMCRHRGRATQSFSWQLNNTVYKCLNANCQTKRQEIKNCFVFCFQNPSRHFSLWFLVFLGAACRRYFEVDQKSTGPEGTEVIFGGVSLG